MHNSASTRRTGPYRRTQRIKGLFADGIWQCDCKPRQPAEHFRVRKEGKNQGRWFYTCQKEENRRCGFFLWDDEAKVREEGAVLNNSRTEPRGTQGVLEGNADVVREQPRMDVISGPGEQRSADPPRYAMHDPNAAAASSRAKPGPFQDNGDAEDEFDDAKDWILNEQDVKRLDNDARQYQQRISAQTPRTPVKRSYANMAGDGLPTPVTDSRQEPGIELGQGESSKRRAIDAEFLNLVSPATTPSPLRFRDVLTGESDDALFAEIKQTLESKGMYEGSESLAAIREVCNRHSLRLQGVVKGRDISRLALKAKDAKIAELSKRIDSLEAELETERAIVRHLRWEKEVEHD